MIDDAPHWSARSRFAAQALRFGRSLTVGSGGTALDFAALSFSIRVLGLEPTWGRVVGLVVGGVVLFLGSRSFAFRATSESALPQMKRFVVSELVGFPLNILAFKLLLWLLPQVAPELLSLLANFALFVTYYYPVRNWVVFKAKPPLVVQPAHVVATSS
ncbi:MAG TPA: GtrA family protein [Polyangiaceae bacterium]|nr:GtrA family protein [Polyangiaceae bacterium]